MGDILDDLGITGSPKKTSDATKDDDHVLDWLGVGSEHETPVAASTIDPATGRTRVYIGSRELKPEDFQSKPVDAPRPVTTLQKVREATDPMTVIPNVLSDVWDKTKTNALGGYDLVKQGLGNSDEPMLPVVPALNGGDGDWQAGRIPKAVGGALATVLSPVSGPLQSGTEALGRLTGNPEFAERAGMFMPMGPAAKTGNVVARTAADVVQPSSRALNKLVHIIGPENVPAVVERTMSNPRLRLMDTDETVRNTARGLIDPAMPKASNIITSSARQSAKDAPGAVTAAYNATMGPPPKILDELDRLHAQAKAVGQGAINPVVKAAKPVNIEPVLSAISDELKPGVNKLVAPGTNIEMTPLQKELVQFTRKISDGDNWLTDPERLHWVQSELRERATDLMKSTTGSEKTLGRELMNYRGKLVDAIDASTPNGAYKAALSKYRDAKDIQGAFDEGLDVLKNSMGKNGIDTHPDTLERWVKQASPEELEARKLAARFAVDQKMKSLRFEARQGTNITDIDFNRQKMRLLFGKEEADKLFKEMEDAREIALTNSKMLHGSDTSRSLAANEELKVRPDVSKATTLPGWASMIGMVGSTAGYPLESAAAAGGLMTMNAGRHVVNKLGQMADRTRNSRFADMIASTGETREEALRRLMAHPAVVREQNRLRSVVSTP